MYDFSTFLHMLPNNELFESIRAIYEASEGDARKYMKKVLISLGLEADMEDSYGPNWSEEVFKKLRKNFVRLGCDMYFLPGIARIAYGELDYDSDYEDTLKTATLRDLVKFITVAHKGDFTRNLERIDVVTTGPQKGMKVKSHPLSFDEIKDMFAKASDEMDEAEESGWEKNNVGKTPNGYQIIVLKDFETAHKFYPYTVTDDSHTAWCYLETEDAYDNYSETGNKLYLALKPGFEKLKPGDPGYGDSMIGFDMGPVNEKGKSKLCVSTNRYNHGTNLETGESGGGDSAYTKTELADILGLPIWTACPGYTEDELIASGKINYQVLAKMFPTNQSLLSMDKDKILELRDKFNVVVEKENEFVGDAFAFSTKGEHGWRTITFAYVCKNIDTPIWYTYMSHVTGSRLIGLLLPENKYLLVDQNGNLVSDTKYSDIKSKGYDPLGVGVNVNGKTRYNFIRPDGDYISEQWFADIEPFGEALTTTVTNEDGKTAFIHKSGNIVSPWFDAISKLKTKLATLYKVKTPEGVFLYNEQFKPCLNYPLRDIYEVPSGEYLMLERNGKMNFYMVESHRLIIDEWFDNFRNNDADDRDVRFYLTPSDPVKYFIIIDHEKGDRMVSDKFENAITNTWFDSVKPFINNDPRDLWHNNVRYFLFQRGDRLNFFSLKTKDFISKDWFGFENPYPEVFQGDIRGLSFNGAPVVVNYYNGKISPANR
jgi:hypothetical protein